MNTTIPPFARGRSKDTIRLIAELREVPQNGMITYAALSMLIDRNVRRSAIGTLSYARSICERHHGIFFEAIIGVGLRRATDGDLASRGPGSVKRLRRQCNRESRRISLADYSKLSDEEKLQHNTALSMLGVGKQFFAAPSVRRVTSAVSESQKQITLKQCLIAFEDE